MTERDRLLDKIGMMILRELQLEARLSSAELGRRVGLSPPAAAERVRKMEEAGLIAGYRASVDPSTLGLVTAFLRLTPNGEATTGALAAIKDMDQVIECHRTTGDASLLLKVVVPDLTALGSAIDGLSDYGAVGSLTVLSTVVADRPIPFELTSPKKDSRPKRD